MNSFRVVNTVSRRMMTSGVHQPFAIKPKFKVPKSTGMAVSNIDVYAFISFDMLLYLITYRSTPPLFTQHHIFLHS